MLLDYRTTIGEKKDGERKREVERKKSSKGEIRADPGEGGSCSLSSPPFSSSPDRGTSIRSFIHSFVRSLIFECALAYTDLPRVASNLDLQLEGKSIALDIQSGVSESRSDTDCHEPDQSRFLFFSFL